MNFKYLKLRQHVYIYIYVSRLYCHIISPCMCIIVLDYVHFCLEMFLLCDNDPLRGKTYQC
jgi:hypothetical protein